MLIAGCNTSPEAQRERDEKTRQDVAKATAKAKPAIEEAGRKLDMPLAPPLMTSSDAQGAREGWKNGPPWLVDVNSASEYDLESLPGISKTDARRIDNQPYATTHDAKNGVSPSDYENSRAGDCKVIYSNHGLCHLGYGYSCIRAVGFPTN